jgi:hypothetical protein
MSGRDDLSRLLDRYIVTDPKPSIVVSVLPTLTNKTAGL